MNFTTIVMPPGVGKTNHKLGWSECQSEQLFYVIERIEIGSGDISRFLATFRFREAAELRRKQGRITFLIEGYGNCHEELYEIPEIRAYFQKLHKEWPCWLYFCCIFGPGLFLVAFVTLNIEVKRSGQNPIEVRIPNADLVNFFKECLPVAACLHVKVGFSAKEGVKLLLPVARYFQIS